MRYTWILLLSGLVACASGEDSPAGGGSGGGDGSGSGSRDGGGSDGTRDAGPPPGAGDAGGGAADAGSDAGGGDVGDAATPMYKLTCDACEDDAECGPEARCAELTTGQRACLPTCVPDIPTCPSNFTCTGVVESGANVCLPVGKPCCVDEDGDEHGQGIGCLGPDCDDTDATRNPAEEDICNGEEDDCDGEVDESPSNCSGPICMEMGGGYAEVGGQSCVDGTCTDEGSVSCGLSTCDGRGGAGSACAETCAPGGVDDNGFCVAGARCVGGTCVEVRCGDGIIDEPEVCDDGNTASGDGCSADCRSVECVGLGTVTFVDTDTNHCYWRSTDVVTSRDVAAARCASGGGHLVYLETNAERNFAYTAVDFSNSSKVYIGLRSTTGGAYGAHKGRWDNGMDLTYGFFRSGEPSGDGDCVEWGPANSLNDIPCGTNRDYVCEREPPGTPR